MVRINKFLAQCNLGSRRSVEKLITSGKIRVNNKVMTNLAFQVDIKNDKVEFENKIISPNQKKYYLILNKPPHYLVTKKDDFGRKTVFDLIPDLNTHIFPVGRLDYLSEGLLVLTNDGDFANQIIHPRHKLPKVYKVTVNSKLNREKIDKLRNGIEINGKFTLPAKVFIDKSVKGNMTLKMTIFEGRKRQIRKMIKNVGGEVIKLKRLQIGNLKLGNLPPGMWRFLKSNEIASLKMKRGKI